MVDITFYGVRGSTPCSGDHVRRYGGNTSCVVLERHGRLPIIFDLGTGLRAYGERHDGREPYRGIALVTHLHWDHIQGIPFFVPIHDRDAQLKVYGPSQDGCTLGEAFGASIRPPFFPVHLTELQGAIAFEGWDRGSFDSGDGAEITVRPVPHVGRTNGYRVECEGISVAYASDHQQPSDGSFAVPDDVLELADGVDLLIHDAQYTAPEFARKSTWGHCTVDYALWVAREAAAKRLMLFHHDPTRDDDSLDDLQRCLRKRAERWGIELLAASEGLTVNLSAVPSRL